MLVGPWDSIADGNKNYFKFFLPYFVNILGLQTPLRLSAGTLFNYTTHGIM